MVLEKLEVEGVFKDEISSRLDNVLSTMVEFGATTEQVAEAQEMLSKASATGSRGVAQMSNVLRTMVDEAEDADKAMESVGLAFDVAAAAGLKAEDAGRELGKMFKGDTSILRKFDAEAKRVADAIDKIVDPAERAAAAERELGRAMKRAERNGKGLAASMSKLDAKLARVGLSSKSAGLAVTAFAAATGGLALKAIKDYGEQSAEAKTQIDAFSSSIDRASASVGRFLVGGEIDELAALGLVIEGVTEDLVDMSGGIENVIEKYTRFAHPLASIGMRLSGASESLAGFRGEHDSLAMSVANAAKSVGGMSGALERLQKVARQEIATASGGLIASTVKPVLGFAEDAAKQMQEHKKDYADFMSLLERTQGDLTKVEKTKRAGGGGGGGGGGRAARPTLPAWVEADREWMQDFNAQRREARRTEGDADLAARSQTMARSLSATMPILREQIASVSMEIDAMNAKAAASDKIWTDLANGGLSLAASSVSDMTQALVEGGDAMASFGASLLASLGDLMTQAGQSFVLLGTGLKNISLGVTSPAGLISIGVGMLALGGALKGFAARQREGAGGAGGGDGGQTAQALQRFGRQLFARETGQESREVMINIEGRQMRGYVLDVAADGVRTGSIPLTPARRR